MARIRHSCVGRAARGGDLRDVVVVGGICPLAGTVREVWAGVSGTLPTTGTLGMHNARLVDWATLLIHMGTEYETGGVVPQ